MGQRYKAVLWSAGLILAAGWLAAELPEPGAGAGAGADKSVAVPPEVQSAIARELAAQLPRQHLLRLPLNDAAATNALALFLSDLDPNRMYFLADDVEAFGAETDRLDDHLRAGDLGFPIRVFERLKERVRDRVAFAEVALKEGFDLAADADFRWRRKDAPWPAGRAEWDALWRQQLQNEYIARLVAVKLAPEKAADAGPEAPRAEDANPLAADEDDLTDRHLAPEDFVLKRHRQFLVVLDDSDRDWITDRFFNAFARSYDPHTEYFSASQAEDFDISMKLSLFGIGALLGSEDGAARVMRLIPGGPAERDGRLRPGDRIIGVAQGDGETVNILHWPIGRSVRLIRGPKGSKVVLTVWPASDVSGATEKRIDLVRDEVKLEERAAKSRLREVPDESGAARPLGVITLPDFYADFKAMRNGEGRRALNDVERLLRELREKGARGVVLDLRGNGGGSLPDAIEIAGLFIPSGPVVQVRDQRGVHVVSDPDPGLEHDGPLVVLVNRLSASASEIVAAALQDYGRAVIVGDFKTHGKGTVQSLRPMDPHDARMGQLKITTARYERISGGSTQREGVHPDIVISSALDAMEIGEEFLPHALPWSSVDPAYYAAFEGEFPPVDALRRRSEARRAADARFRAREDLVRRIGERLASDTISLNLEKRIELARSQKELDDLQSQMTDEESDSGDDRDDLVLVEALNILRDMVAAREGQAPAPLTAGHP